ncbi:MAG: TonB-dependent siderophore receptor [Burkholderiales bacterium]|nr:TonB-dependent siderophore receptor [Burkholderiales bacterium]MDE2628777.1 TonB-dependent siderophore receptor [Burkholderiales bacterium]
MAHHTRHHAYTAIAAAALLAATQARAQTPPEATMQLNPVTVTGRAALPATVSGWGDTPLANTPMQASVYTAEELRDAGVQRLSDLVTLDPAVSDAYNAEGYWDFLTVRGFVLDNQFNFRRDGLPINAETSIPLDNKERIEILQGTSGIQAGTSAPGGLVNYVVKRPTDAPLRSAFIEWHQPGTVTGAVDLSQRFGVDQAFGVRLNAAAAHLDPMVRSSTGNRRLFALAADWRAGTDTLLEAEVETSHRSQPSQPGFSMLGNVVPAPGDPRINLNNQPWSLPVVFDATTASLRWQQRLSSDWRFVAHAGMQHLRSDDRLAYPFGCSKEGNYDRYCSDGSFDFYEYRSDGEQRRTTSLDLHAEGRLETAGIEHRLTFGALGSRYRSRLQPRLDDSVIVGTGTVDGLSIVPSLPALGLVPNPNQTERSTELYLRDAIKFNDGWTAWLGVRRTHIARASVLTDGSEPTSYTRSFTTPWLAASYAFARNQLVYASWGRGVESSAVPNRPQYTDAGQALTALSRQAEVGVKGSNDAFAWSLAAFDIQRPQPADVGTCDPTVAKSCTTQLDGSAHHRGVEATGTWHQGAWTLRGGSQWLRARREGSQTAAINGLQPTNVPALTLKAQAAYDVASMPGLNLQANVMHETRRMVLPDNSASIPGYTRVDAALRYDTRLANARAIWRVGIDNLFDKRAWRESPYEFSHVYLYPLAPRTLRVSLQVDL